MRRKEWNGNGWCWESELEAQLLLPKGAPRCGLVELLR
jgi:hypothetical protein